MPNTITFRTQDQKVLWDHEIRGQISDGHWENARPDGHWKVWCDADSVVDPFNVGRNFPARKSNYNLLNDDLLSCVSGRMIVYVKAARLFGANNASTIEHLYGFCSDDFRGFPNTEGAYWDKLRAEIMAVCDHFNISIDAVRKFMDQERYDINDLRKDLREMMMAMRFNVAENKDNA